MAQHFFVTGGAGFIGSHFVDQALAKGHKVTVFDDFSTGKEFFLEGASKSPFLKVVRGDIRNLEDLNSAMGSAKPTWVIHLAANADVRFGLNRTRRDLDYNTIGTWNVAESARLAGCKNILFSSTGSVYGEPEVFPTPESCPFPIQTSLYGASKAAGEAILSAYTFGFEMNAVVFRFVSILGPRYTHGHVFDFIKSLLKDPKKLQILGNGKQNKSYLHIEDLMRGLFMVIEKGVRGFEVYNIGHDDSLIVADSAKTICQKMNLSPTFEFTGGERGWVGDSPRIQLDTSKLKKLGWAPKHDLKSSVQDTVDYLVKHQFLLEVP